MNAQKASVDDKLRDSVKREFMLELFQRFAITILKLSSKISIEVFLLFGITIFAIYGICLEKSLMDLVLNPNPYNILAFAIVGLANIVTSILMQDLRSAGLSTLPLIGILSLLLFKESYNRRSSLLK